MPIVFVEDMKMPVTCCDCDFKRYSSQFVFRDGEFRESGTWVCARTSEVIWNTQRGERCPLKNLSLRNILMAFRKGGKS